MKKLTAAKLVPRKKRGRAIILWTPYDWSKTAILGLDCSSRVIGWGLIDPVGYRLLAHGHFKPLDSKHSLLERLNDVYDSITNLCDWLRPKTVVIEDIVLFMKGRSSARTITTLAVFNRTAALAAFRRVGDVQFRTVGSIRKQIRKLARLDSTPDKEDMPDLVRDHLDHKFIDVPKRGGGRGAPTFDEADGIAVAWARLIEDMGEEEFE